MEVSPPSAGNTAYGKLPQQTGDTSTQTNGFLGSNGIKYKRYDRQSMTRTSADWLTYLRGTPTNTLVSEKILTELSSPETYGENYVEYAVGYFYAPVTGSYRFSVLADDDFLMMMSTVRNNANIANLQLLLGQEWYNNHHYISYARVNVTQNQKTITLTQGYYYF